MLKIFRNIFEPKVWRQFEPTLAASPIHPFILKSEQPNKARCPRSFAPPDFRMSSEFQFRPHGSIHIHATQATTPTTRAPAFVRARRARIAGERAERAAQPPATGGAWAWPRSEGGRRQGHMVPSIREARTCPPARSLVPSLSSSFAARARVPTSGARGRRRPPTGVAGGRCCARLRTCDWTDPRVIS